MQSGLGVARLHDEHDIYSLLKHRGGLIIFPEAVRCGVPVHQVALVSLQVLLREAVCCCLYTCNYAGASVFKEAFCAGVECQAA